MASALMELGDHDDLVAAWRNGIALPQHAAQFAGALDAACRTLQGASALAAEMTPIVADVAMAWAQSQASRTDLALAPLVCEAQATRARRGAAARARLLAGPLYDALHCLPAVTREADGEAVRRRVDCLLWEAGARALSLGALGAWAWSRPGTIQALILDRVEGDLGDRVRAARALAVLGDGFRDEGGLPMAGRIAAAVEKLLEHPEPLVWTTAARAAGRLAANLSAVRRLMFVWHSSDAMWRRRRVAAAIASLPAGTSADTWVDRHLTELLAPETRKRDPWLVASLGVAAPHLARERPEWWERVAAQVAADAGPELAWSLARGLAALGRRGAGRGLTAAEVELVSALRDRAGSAIPRSAEDAARRYETEVHLAWALGEPPPVRLCLERLDYRLSAALDGQEPGELPVPLACFDAALRDLSDADDVVRGRAHAALRSATRAQAIRLAELVAAAAGTLPSARDSSQIPAVGADAVMIAGCEARLAAEMCEYGLRSTLVGCLGDLVDAAAPGPTGEHGRAAARALRAVAQSKWALEIVENAGMTAPDKARAREIRRFRKPLEDLFDRCVAVRPQLRAVGESTVPPALAAWWALCAGGAQLPGELDRDGGGDAYQAMVEALAVIDRALRDGALGLSPARWGEQIAAALVRLGAGDTALAVVVARMSSVLEAARALQGERDDGPVARELLGELAQVMTMYQEIAEDLDAALAPAGATAELGLADLAGGPGAAWLLGRDQAAGTMWGGNDTAPLLVRWERAVAPAVRQIVLPLARALAELVAVEERRERRAGRRIGGFELVELLGGGGMGEVWKAKRGQQVVALKLPREDASPKFRESFAEALRQEAGRLERMSFAKVATFIEAGVDDGVPFLATAYLRGRTLAEHVFATDAPRIGLPLMRRIVRDVCTGLHNLHEVRVVHRDLTPRNVFLRFRGQDEKNLPTLKADPFGRRIDEATLIDLGIAQAFGEKASEMLSFGYVAPEVLDNAAVGPEADVYSLGATIFHVLTGHQFAAGLPPAAAAAWHVTVEPFDDPAVRAAAAALPDAFVHALASATRLDPAQRITLEELDAAFA